ncbi:hypothetical protein ACB092_07G121600 [Castanea dentata]
MGKDTIANIITSICNANMNRKGTVQIPSTNITKNLVKILLREGFTENVRDTFFGFNLQHRRNRKGPCKTVLNIKRISRPGLRIYSLRSRNYNRIWSWYLYFFLFYFS